MRFALSAVATLFVLGCSDPPPPERSDAGAVFDCACSSAPPAIEVDLDLSEAALLRPPPLRQRDTARDPPRCPKERWAGDDEMLRQWRNATSRAWKHRAPTDIAVTLMKGIDGVGLGTELGARAIPTSEGHYRFVLRDEESALRAFKILLCEDAVTRATLIDLPSGSGDDDHRN